MKIPRFPSPRLVRDSPPAMRAGPRVVVGLPAARTTRFDPRSPSVIVRCGHRCHRIAVRQQDRVGSVVDTALRRDAEAVWLRDRAAMTRVFGRPPVRLEQILATYAGTHDVPFIGWTCSERLPRATDVYEEVEGGLGSSDSLATHRNRE